MLMDSVVLRAVQHLHCRSIEYLEVGRRNQKSGRLRSLSHQASPGLLAALKEHCRSRCGRECKVVMWAHNCHVSNARHTEICWRWNEINTGQLVKEKFGDKAFSVGFT
jgi:erythromycin esterase-like protein